MNKPEELNDEHIKLYLVFTDIILLLMLISLLTFFSQYDFDLLKSSYSFELALNSLSLAYSIMMTTLLFFDTSYDIGLMSIFIPITLFHGTTMWADEMMYICKLNGWSSSIHHMFNSIATVSQMINLLLFWNYLKENVHNKKINNILNYLIYSITVLLIVTIIVNRFYPVLFIIDSALTIQDTFLMTVLVIVYLVLLFILMILGMVEKIPGYKKAIVIGSPALTIIGTLLYLVFPKYYLSYAFMQLSFIATFIISYSKKSYDLTLKENELIAAASMQKNMLPEKELVGDNDSFYVIGAMKPAKEVGGDLYDYFMIDDTHLCIGIGDVSGKGTASALFMSRAFSCFKDYALMGLEPGDIFTKVNSRLFEGNKEYYFITAWCGILDLSTGTLTYVNAGHEKPIYAKSSGGTIPLSSQTNLILGITPNQIYKQDVIDLKKGDMILLYTDGVEDEHDSNGEKYGFDRLFKAFKTSLVHDYKDILKNVYRDVTSYMDGTNQYDDITMLLFRYGGNDND